MVAIGSAGIDGNDGGFLDGDAQLGSNSGTPELVELFEGFNAKVSMLEVPVVMFELLDGQPCFRWLLGLLPERACRQ